MMDPVQLFDEDGEFVGSFATIQAAVDFARNGDTIVLSEGTYIEQVIVDGLDDLTIKAAEGADVTIQAPDDLVETGRSSSDREIHAVLTVTNSTNVAVEDIEIDGAGRGNTVDEGAGAGQANFYGIFYRNASGELIDVDVTGVRDAYPGGTAAGGEPLVSGVQRGVAVVVDNDPPTGGDPLLAFAMTGGVIDDFQKNATSFSYADLSVTGVTVTGGGAQTIIAQNGFQMLGCTGLLAGNTVTGIGYAGPASAYSGAFLGLGNTDLAITGNTIVGSNIDSADAKVVGIFLFDFFGEVNSGGEISGNTISSTDTGIGVYGIVEPSNIHIENNTVTELDNGDPFVAGVDFQPDPALTTPFDVDGSGSSDILFGGAGNDSLSALGGDDLIDGNGGDDTLDGGDGIDTATYAGSRADHVLATTTDAGGRVTAFAGVADSNATDGNDGSDTLAGVEILAFGDITLDLTQAVQLFDAGGELVATFDTIQDAIDAAADDYVIRAAAGDYAENLVVDVDVTILGARSGLDGRDPTRGAGETILSGGVTVTASGVTLDGLQVSGEFTPAGAPWPVGLYVTGSDLTIANSLFTTDSASVVAAILTGQTTGLDVGTSKFEGYPIGAYVSGTASTGEFHDNLFQGEWSAADPDTFAGMGNGVNSESSGIVIRDNTFDALYAGVIQVLAFGPETLDVNGFVFDNLFTGNRAERPIQIYPNGDTRVVSGTNENEAFNGDLVAGGKAFEFSGNGGDDRMFGATLGDRFTGGAGNDLFFGGGGDDHHVVNDTAGGTTFSLATDSNPLDAGDQGGWQVTSADGVDILNDVEVVEHSDGRTLLVGNGGFDTIQAAVDAADPGDVVRIAPGTYPENVSVTKAISLIGDDPATTAIDPSSGNAVTLSGDIDAGGAAAVRIEGLGLNDGETGIQISSTTQLSSLVVDNTSFDGNRIYAIGSGSGGFGLGSVSITNSTFTDNGVGPASPNGSGSIVLFGFTGDATIQNVVISTSSTDATAQNDRADNAIQITGRDPSTYDVNDPGGTIVIDNVDISGFYHKPPLFIQGYTDLTGFSFTDVTITAGSNWGYAVFIDPVSSPGTDAPGAPGYPGHFAGGAASSTIDLSDVTVTNLSTVDAGYDVFVRGTDADDNQIGTNARDVLNANAEGDIDYGGDDTLSGLGGNDTLFGGVGADELNGGDDDDALIGGDDVDTLGGGDGNDTLNGGAGNDTLSGDNALTTTLYTQSVDNQDNAGSGTPDGDMGARDDYSASNPVEFDIVTATDPAVSATLTILATDIDPSGTDGPEQNEVFVNGVSVGFLTIGASDEQTTSTFTVDPSILDPGGVNRITIHNTQTAGEYFFSVESGTLAIVTDSTGGLDDHDTAVFSGDYAGYAVTMVTGTDGRVTGFTEVADNDAGNGDEGTDSLTGIEALQFADVTLDLTQAVQLFDGNGALVGTFDTLQAAVDAASDTYTIRADAGTYDEDLVIDVGVTILGADAGDAASGRDPSDGAGATNIVGHAKITAADGVTIDGVRFVNDATTTGGGPSNPSLQILSGGGSTGHQVVNSIFWSEVAGGASGVDDRAISISPIADGTIQISNNVFSGASEGLFSTASWGRAIWFDGGGVDLSVSGNLIEWARTGLNLDMGGDSTALVSGNTLQNLGSGVSVGVDDAGLTIEANDISNVGTEFNLRNLTNDVTFDAETAIDTLTPVGDLNDLMTLLGGAGDDHLTGTAGGDIIDANGLSGSTTADSDVVNGGGGSDLLFGKLGDDTLNGGAGDDMLDGGGGIDAAEVGTGASFAASASNWIITSSDGVDTVSGIEIVDSGLASRTLLVGSGGFATIQEAIDAADPGDTILVAEGTYAAFTVDKAVTIEGRGEVEIVGSFRTDNGVPSGMSVGEWLQTATSYSGAAGAGATIAANGVTLTNLNFSSFLHGVDFGDSDGLTLNDVDISESVRGIVKLTNGVATNFTMNGGSITDSYQGITIDSSGGTDAGFDGVVLDGVLFENLTEKGFYADHLSNADLLNLVMTNVGEFGRGPAFGASGTGEYGAGIDINVKYGDYADIEIAGFTFTNVGSSSHPDTVPGDFGGAITIKARDDAPSYSSIPATLDGVSIHDGTIDGTSTGIRIGEPGKNNAGPTGVTVEDVTVANAAVATVDNASQAVLTVTGTDGDDLISTGSTATGPIVFHGEEGADDISGGGGDDAIDGGTGADSLDGGDGDDLIDGGAGNDFVAGGAGLDTAAIGSGPSFLATALGWIAISSDGADILVDVEIVEDGSGARTLLVGAGGFDTIQEALDAALDGDTVLLAAGTYAGNITITKDITLAGPNAGTPATGARSSEAIIDGGVYMHADGATLDGLTILGGGMLAGNPAGIYVDRNGVTLANLVVESDGTAGTGITTPFNGGVTGLTLIGSAISSWNTGAYFNPTTQFAATANSFDDNGVGLAGDDWEDGTLIDDNSFTNNGFGHVGYGSFDSIDDVGAYFGSGNSYDATGGRIGIFAYGDGTPGGQTITGTSEADFITGAEFVAGSGDGASFFGGEGDDLLDGGAGSDLLFGDQGTDILLGGAGADELDGGTAADRLEGGLDDDLMRGGFGRDTLFGEAGADTMLGESDADRLHGGAAADTLDGGLDDDLLRGNHGRDKLFGASGTDTLSGGAGADRLHGGAATDLLVGGGGNDVLDGDHGNDVLEGGAGRDRLAGGDGGDTFLFGDGDSGATSGSADRIGDFASGDDLIDLGGMDADVAAAGDQAFSFIGAGAFSGTAGELRFEAVGADIFVEGDVDGDSLADFSIRVEDVAAVTSGDFVL